MLLEQIAREKRAQAESMDDLVESRLMAQATCAQHDQAETTVPALAMRVH
jgi:hypothetical protein